MLTIISGIFGGLLRLVPEFLKIWNAKNEMAHERAMRTIDKEIIEIKGGQELDQIHAKNQGEYDKGGLDALKAAIEAQAKPSGVKWVDALNTLMRPLITLQWVVILYPAAIVTKFYILITSNVGVLPALDMAFGEPERALVAFIVDFWFVGRVLDAGRKRNV